MQRLNQFCPSRRGIRTMHLAAIAMVLGFGVSTAHAFPTGSACTLLRAPHRRRQPAPHHPHEPELRRPPRGSRHPGEFRSWTVYR